ncbi:hypothetical protein DICVIV_01022 [Dictyocaulus viviparus]|uniref:Uncharacterized protein n=1 Tax=Dictyocaulus viviparus TaxID=29172 RepID=A0A0D8Y7X2_DICVI|nr:hypothetical protein DICVIV_01022 [Dictyocaulus viviparus]
MIEDVLLDELPLIVVQLGDLRLDHTIQFNCSLSFEPSQLDKRHNRVSLELLSRAKFIGSKFIMSHPDLINDYSKYCRIGLIPEVLQSRVFSLNGNLPDKGMDRLDLAVLELLQSKIKEEQNIKLFDDISTITKKK